MLQAKLKQKMRTVINVEDITPEVTGATSKDYLAGYLRAKEKLAMQIKAFSACGLAEAEQRAKAQMRFVDGKICEYRAKIKEEEREMYRMVLKVMMACDYANGLSLDFAEYFERKTHTAEGYDLVADVDTLKKACRQVLSGMERCFGRRQLSEYSKIQAALEEKINPLYEASTNELEKIIERTR